MEGKIANDPGVKPQSALDESFKNIKSQITRLEDRLMPVLVCQTTEKKETEPCKPTELLEQLSKVFKKLCELNNRIRL